MKRSILLALALVSSLASVAGAVPIITGATTIEPGQTVNLTLEGTVAEASGGTAGNSNTPAGGFSSGVFIDLTNTCTYYFYPIGHNNPKITGSSISNLSSPYESMGAQALLNTYYYGISFVAKGNPGWDETTDVDTGQWFTFDVYLTANYVSQGGKTDGSEYLPVDIGLWSGDLGGLDLQVVPEPVTIALLGIGGLALLGKRRN